MSHPQILPRMVVGGVDGIDDCFGGAGVVLAGLAGPEADFELGGIGEPVPLVGEEEVFYGGDGWE